jgi:hypothetical protein
MRKRYVSVSMFVAVLFLFFLSFHVEAQLRPDEIKKKKPPFLTLLRVTFFQINNGAESTSSNRVILNNSAQGEPSHWRASESPDFSKNVQVGLYNVAPQYTLSIGSGVKTVYFQALKAQSDLTFLYSEAKSDTINYSPPPAPAARRDFVIRGGDAYEYAKSKGFNFTAIPRDPTSNCRMYGSGGSSLLVQAVTSRLVGSKCDFILFGGKQLNEGWTFKSYTQWVDCSPPKRNYSVDQKPTAGNRDMTFKIHAWADAPMTAIGEPSSTLCQFSIEKIVLEGPATAGHWGPAFD